MQEDNNKFSDIFQEPFKNEFFLSVDSFGKVSTYNSLASLARLIQRLILMQPKSYPDDPDMGVGIIDYQFEFLDRTTFAELNDKIMNQINTYIPNNNIENILIDRVDSDRRNTIGILLNFSNNIEGKTNMILTFEQLGKTGKIDSKIYI